MMFHLIHDLETGPVIVLASSWLSQEKQDQNRAKQIGSPILGSLDQILSFVFLVACIPYILVLGNF